MTTPDGKKLEKAASQLKTQIFIALGGFLTNIALHESYRETVLAPAYFCKIWLGPFQADA